MGFKIKNSLTGEFEKLPILTLKGEKGETGGVEEYNKVDYMGNKYETLKQANDANVEYAVKTAIGEFNYLDYEGQHITATNTIEGQSKSAILKGQTLVTNFYSSTIEKTAIGLWVEMPTNMSDVKLPIEPSTDYLFVVDVIENSLVGNEVQNISLRFGETDDAGVEPSAFTSKHAMPLHQMGIYKFILTSKSDLSNITILDRKQLYENCTSGKIKFRYMILKYQEGMENWDIPYFEGMQSVKMPVLKTTGKNLFDGKLKYGAYSSQAGEKITDNNCIRNVNMIKVQKGATIYKNKNVVYRMREYREDGTFINTNQLFVESSLKLSDETSYISFYFLSRDDEDGINSKIILTPSIDTSYEPYKSNILSCNEDVELRGIGDVKDTLDLMTGKVVERIGEIVLDGSEGWNSFVIEPSGLGRMLMSLECNSFITDKVPVVNYGDSWNNTYECISKIDKKNIVLYLSGVSSANEFISKLNQNPITVQYVLATESIKTVDLSDNHVYSYKDVTHYDCSSAEGSLVPTLSVKVPTDVQATIAQQRETIQTLNSENERLNQIQEALKASMLDSQVQLMNLSWDTDFEVFTLRESIAPKDFPMDSKTGSNIDKFSQAKFIIENDCPDLEKLNSQIEYYFSKDIFSQEQFEELTDLISIVKGENSCEY